MSEKTNTGHCNTGDRNTGHFNTGDWNTGNGNTGHCNTGNGNTGHCNTGDRNTGDCNTGNGNTGNRNTGHCNTGNRNTGDWNTGDYNTGFFCTETPKARFFDRETDLTHEQARELIPFVELPVAVEWVASADMTDAEKSENPNHVTIGGFLRQRETDVREAMKRAWPKLPEETRQKFLALPNFDADKFLACTGVDVRQPPKSTVRLRLADGREVEIEGEVIG